MQTPDWLVIGGGIPALVAAFYLQQRGERVLVVDNNNPSASRAGAGVLSPLPPWGASPLITELAAAGAAATPRLLAALGDDCGIRQPGLLVLPPFAAAALAAWRRGGGVATAIEAAAVSPLLPAGAALHVPAVSILQPRRLLKALRRRLPRTLATVKRLSVAGGKVQRVVLGDGGWLAAAKVLLSAGAWTPRLCPPPAPVITPVRGQMLLYDNPGICLPTVVMQEAQDFYLLQRSDGRLLAGSTVEEVGFRSRPSRAGIAHLRRRAAALLPPLAGRAPRHSWAGIRPAAGKPVICRHPRLENLYINSGHFRYGVTMAPAAAAHLLALVDDDSADNPTTYAPMSDGDGGGSGRT